MSTSLRIAFLLLGTSVGSPVAAQVTRIVSVDSAEALGNGFSAWPSISADGRYVAFHSRASNFVPGDTNLQEDVFVRDLVAGTTEIVSVSSSGAIGNHESLYPSISADGRYVAFQSLATNLIPSDAYSGPDIYVRDRVAGTTEKVNLTSSGGQTVSNMSFKPSISADGRYVAFDSFANDLVAGDTNSTQDVFVRDLVAGTTERVSVSTGGGQGINPSSHAKISADGRYVGFSSSANLVPGDSTPADVFVHDRVTHVTEIVSVASDGSAGNAPSSIGAISSDGRFIAFSSDASNLVANDTNAREDAFLRDRLLGTTRRVSVNTGEGQGNGNSWPTSITADGRFVAMHGNSYNLVPGDVNNANDVFVRDRQNDTMQRVSLDSAGAQGSAHSLEAAISADGRWVAFTSGSNDLVAADTNDTHDIFVRDLEATGFAIVCDPGVPPVAPCPCGNPPVGSSRGCNNSSGTGGAALNASGVTELSSDSLVFTTNGEKPTALSIVLQGTVYLSNGLVYGQGIRCVGGSLKRLYVKTASGGMVTAPNFGAGDPSVSAQSAAKGDPISAGQNRWYLVYYRDGDVLGGCPAASTFNATQTGMVSWSP